MRTVGLGLLVLFVVGCGGSSYERAARAPEGSGAPRSSVAADRAPSAEPMGAVAAPAAPLSAPSAPPTLAPAEAVAVDAPSVAAPPMPTAARPVQGGGQLTAGVWDDNLNFDFFKPYADRFARQSKDFAMFSASEIAEAQRTTAQRAPHTELDVQLVLDTTGSMGDELAYLQGEFDAIASRLRTTFPNVTPRWSLVVYRDHGDAYVTRAFDFTTDAARFRRDLRAQAAAGGGDTPEAVVEGLGAGLKQGWRTADNVAKLAFWVADAPAHPGEGRALGAAIRDARKKGVHIYPVASSDVDDTAEFQMRAAAQLTGGRYLFLTDDSGIGNGHAEPHIPCYNVTRLDRAIVRMIQVELSGRHVEAEGQEVVRRVGAPGADGKCKLTSGLVVASF